MNWSSNSTARNFNNNWLIYLNFSNITKLFPNIWFIKNSKCQQFSFWKRSRQKKHKFFIFLKDRCFVMGGPSDKNFRAFWETPADLQLCNFSRNIAKVMSIWTLKELYKSFLEWPWSNSWRLYFWIYWTISFPCKTLQMHITVDVN